MTQRRGRSALLPAVLVALAVGAGTAGVSTVLGLAPGLGGTIGVVGAGAPGHEVPLGLFAQRIAIPPQDPADPTSGGGGPGSGPRAGEGAPASTTAPSPPPTSTEAEPTTAQVAVDARVLALVNRERESAGCDPLTADARLAAAAQAHAADMSAEDYLSHVSQDGRSFVDRSRAEGHPDPAAENIAKGQRTAEHVMRAWMDSPGHRATILDCDLRTLGVGFTAEGSYWVQDFGR